MRSNKALESSETAEILTLLHLRVMKCLSSDLSAGWTLSIRLKVMAAILSGDYISRWLEIFILLLCWSLVRMRIINSIAFLINTVAKKL